MTYRHPILSRRTLLLAGGACAVGTIGGGTLRASSRTGDNAKDTRFEIRGISYPSFRNGNYGSAESASSLERLASTGANYVAISPAHFAKTIRDSEFFGTEQTESQENVVQAIRDARAAGLSVLLKPHIDPRDGKPRAAFAPRDLDAWFRNYQAFIGSYAALAASHQVEMFCIGCEFDHMIGPAYRDRWIDVARTVRAVYDGPITYASGYIQAKDVTFWDAVDYIGVDAYNPLSSAPDPSIDELAAGWLTVSSNPWVASLSDNKPPLRYYREISDNHRKPMIFAEIGYKSVSGATSRPGDWKADGPLNLELQARAYEAFFRIWSPQSSWMKGVFLWHWVTRSNPEQSLRGAKDYTPQNKPAAAVIARWYQG